MLRTLTLFALLALVGCGSKPQPVTGPVAPPPLAPPVSRPVVAPVTPPTAASGSTPKTVHVEITVDGSDVLTLGAKKLNLRHISYVAPSHVTIDGKQHDVRVAMPMTIDIPALAGADLRNAKIVKSRGRGNASFKQDAGAIEIVIEDGDPGADVYAFDISVAASTQAVAVSPSPVTSPSEFKTLTSVPKPEGVSFKTIDFALKDAAQKEHFFTMEVPNDVVFKPGSSGAPWSGTLSNERDFSVALEDIKPGNNDLGSIQELKAKHERSPDFVKPQRKLIVENEHQHFYEMQVEGAKDAHTREFAVEQKFGDVTLLVKDYFTRGTGAKAAFSRQAGLVMVYSASTLKAVTSPTSGVKAIEIPKPDHRYLSDAFFGLFLRRDEKRVDSGGIGLNAKRNKDLTLAVSVPEKDVREAWISFHMGAKEGQDYECVMYLKDFPKGQKFALINTEFAKWRPRAEVEIPDGVVKVEIYRKGGALTCKINDKAQELKVNDESVKTAAWEPGFSMPPGGTATIAYIQFK